MALPRAHGRCRRARFFESGETFGSSACSLPATPWATYVTQSRTSEDLKSAPRERCSRATLSSWGAPGNSSRGRRRTCWPLSANWVLCRRRRLCTVVTSKSLAGRLSLYHKTSWETKRPCPPRDRYTLPNYAFARWLDPDNPDLAQSAAAAQAQRAEGLPTVPSTIAVELATNPFMRASALQVWRVWRCPVC